MMILETLSFLRNYSHLITFCCYYATLYPAVYYLCLWNESFEKLKQEKRLYVVKNIIKSASLCYLTFKTLPYIPNLLSMGDIDMTNVRWWGSIFVANDLTALMLVPNLPSNTRNHHIMTFILLNVVYFYDGNNFEVIKLISIYTIYSYFAFLVNLYLGFRHLELPEQKDNKLVSIFNKSIDKLRIMAYYNYGLCLFMNWGYHLYYGYSIYPNFTMSHLGYLVFLYPIINDDIILLSWLKYKKNL